MNGHAFLPGQLVSVVGWCFRDPGLRSAAFKTDASAVGILMEASDRRERSKGVETVHVLVDARLGWVPASGLIDIHALGDDT